MQSARFEWAELAEGAGIIARPTVSGGTMTNQGTREACLALEALVGVDNIRRGVDLWLAGRVGETAAASAAWSVVTHIRSWQATEYAYGVYREAKSQGDAGLAALAVILIKDICHPQALQWVDEFLAFRPTAAVGVGLVDQGLFQGVLDAEDERIAGWLMAAEAYGDSHIQQAVQWVRDALHRHHA